MSFTDIFIRRPVLAIVVSLLICLIGFICITRIQVRQYPKIDIATINIFTKYPGASAQTMESFVTTPIENAIAGVDSINYITASNKFNESDITIYLKLDANIDRTLSQIRSKVASVRWKLPEKIQDPVIRQEDPNSTGVLYFAFTSTNMREEAITDYVLRHVQPQIQTLDGVAQARILNEKQYAMRIWLDPTLMAAYNVTPTDVYNALQRNNLPTQAGKIKSKLQKFTIIAETDVANPHDFNNLVIRDENGHLIRLRNIGRAQLGAKENDFSGEYEGKHAIILKITAKSTANPLIVAKAVKTLLPSIKANLPNDLHMTTVWDGSKFISDSLYEVGKTILEATLLVILVIFIFLGSLRSVIIPVLTIPLSLLGACALMYMLGFSVNLLTLLAFVLAIGLVVDDAIVVVENIHRHIENGVAPMQAALQGAKEIRFAIIAMTLTLAAVYAPIGFTEGLSGKLFREFAFTLAGSVIVSGIVALTLSPMMCGKLLKHSASKKTLSAKIDRALDYVSNSYQRLLITLMSWFANPLPNNNQRAWYQRKAIYINLILYGLSLFCLYFLFTNLPSELLPKQDRNYLIIRVKSPASANLHYTESYTKKLFPLYKQLQAYKASLTVNGWPDVNSAFSLLLLKDRADRKLSTQQIQEALRKKLETLPGIQAFPTLPSSLPGIGSKFPVNFVLTTTGSYQGLDKAMHKLETAAKQNPDLFNVDSDLRFDNPQLKVKINRNKAGDMGITMADISIALNTMIGEPIPSQFSMQGRSYDVIPQVFARFRENPNTLKWIYIRNSQGQLIPLANLVKLKEVVGPRSLNHFQQLRSATLEASVKPGKLGESLHFLVNYVKQNLPKNIKYSFSGETKQFIESSNTMMLTLMYAAIFIFLVLAAQFESFTDPLLILLCSVPLSFIGALLALRLTDGSLNLYTYIGLTTLIGLISKHGILMVEFAKQQRLLGKNVHEAIIEAASIRLRPILMTTAAMVLGALPLAFATGAGSEPRQQIGWIIVGGMSVGTLLTLFVVPIAYTYLSSKKVNLPHLATEPELQEE